MTSRTHLVAGEGQLTRLRVLREAAGMFRIGYARVAVVALILFVPPPAIIALLSSVLEDIESDPGLGVGVGVAVVLLMTLTIRLFGPVVYAGYLEAAVGHEYFHGRMVSMSEVLRSLPWIRLLVAEVIIVAGAVIGLGLFVVPGLIWLTLFALVGPVIVQERRSVIQSMRRTYQLSRPAWKMTFTLVVLVIGIEHAVEEAMHLLVHESGLFVQLVVEWAIASIVGGAVGLIEVALASELIARAPLGAQAEGVDPEGA